MSQTSLNSTGVASTGALSLQSNGTTEAIGISTGQVATLAQNPVLTSGTANGVAYLNGSKVVTTGTALTFDGTTLTSNSFSTANGGNVRFAYSANTSSRSWKLVNDLNVYGDFNIIQSTTQSGTTYQSVYSALNDGTQFWSVNNAEQMRLTSTGLGIGTSSPAQRLSVYYSANTDPTLTANAFAPVSFNNAGVELTYGVYTSSPFAAWLQAKTGGGAWPLAINPLGGSVGIGTSSPNANTKLDVSGPIRAGGYTVATLPTGVVGARAYVTDAVTAVFMATPTGGGSVKTPVFYNGTAWVCG